VKIELGNLESFGPVTQEIYRSDPAIIKRVFSPYADISLATPSLIKHSEHTGAERKWQQEPPSKRNTRSDRLGARQIHTCEARNKDQQGHEEPCLLAREKQEERNCCGIP
jgi:hypothetical protein